MLATAAPADSITHGPATVNMDFVTVGDPGNEPDDEIMKPDGTTGYGGVDYVYQIGKCEVSKNQWDVVNGIEGDLLDDVGHYWGGDQPVVGISWYEMAMFCNWLTSGDVTAGAYVIDGSGVVTGTDRESAVSNYSTIYVIPTENEWYKAAYYDPQKWGGAGYWDYPTGSDTRPDGVDGRGDTRFDVWCRDGGDLLEPTDVDNAGVLSRYGTMGQGGNVWEWHETAIGSKRGLRGGYYFRDGAGRTNLDAESRRFALEPTAEMWHVGFRVASIPGPILEPNPGDADLSGTTDLSDFNIWNANKFMSPTDWSTGDFDGNGGTDLSDFNIWNAHKFTTAEGGAAPAPTEVPEPSMLVMLAIIGAVFGGIAWRRRRK